MASEVQQTNKKKHNWLNIILVIAFIGSLLVKVIGTKFLFANYLQDFIVGGVVLLIYLQRGFQNTSIDISGTDNSVYVVENYDALSEETINKILSQEAGRYIEALDYIERVKSRLKTNIKDLQTSSHLNLVIGLLTAIGGLFFLFHFVTAQSPSEDNTKLIIYNISRLSLVILTEIFAFFFLRLYKTTLSELKYFQNELTNIDLKALAIRFAQINKDSAISEEIIKELIKTERNFILQAGQTTIGLEQNRIDNQTHKSLVDNLTQLTESLKSKEKRLE